MKTFRKVFCVMFVICALVMVGPVASAAQSTVTTRTVYGHTYISWAVVAGSQNEATAISCNSSKDNRYIPEGYAGARARLYKSSGVLVATSGWGYNVSYANGITSSCDYPATQGEYYYSKGQVRMFNGDGYNTYETTRTANVAPIRTYSTYSEIKRNAAGEIYGSELFLNDIGIEPDLILAEGDDGVIGYVRSDDINRGGSISSLEDAISYGIGTPYSVPLYEEDGETVIGTFQVSGSFE